MNIFKKAIRTILNKLDIKYEAEREEINDAARMKVIDNVSRHLGGIEYAEMLEEKKRICEELGITYHHDLGEIGDYRYDIVFIEKRGDGEDINRICNNSEYYLLIKSNKILTNVDRLENLKKEINLFKEEKTYDND